MKRFLFSIALLLLISNSYAQNIDPVELANHKQIIRLCCGIPDSTKKVMFIVDGKIFWNNRFDGLDPELIKNITVLNGRDAVPLYGEDAKNGAIIIKVIKDARWVDLSAFLKRNKVRTENLGLPVYFITNWVRTSKILVNKKSKYNVSVLNSAAAQLKNDTYSGNYLSISETKH